jgi:RNA polymerase sigma-70 factor (ECF subfamily)
MVMPIILGWLAFFPHMLRMESEPEEAGANLRSSDHDLMVRLARGDSLALRPIFDRWKLPLIGYFYRSLGNRTDAEDLALQTLERVYRAAERYRAEAQFSTWLFAIARRELLHELRRRRRKPVEPVPPADLEFVGMDLSGIEARKVSELEEHLLAVLQQLPEKQRSALLLSAGGELSHDGIADALGVSPNNLYVILHRGRAALRALFKA